MKKNLNLRVKVEILLDMLAQKTAEANLQVSRNFLISTSFFQTCLYGNTKTTVLRLIANKECAENEH
jgi:hypothetical protein